MIRFYWQGIVVSQEGILEMNGVHNSIDKNSAEKELSACGIRVFKIREATPLDLKIERLKQLKRNIILSKNKKG